LNLNENWLAYRLGKQDCRVDVHEIAPSAEMSNLQAAPRVRPHFLGAIASADDSELFDPVGSGREVVEKDKRPAGSAVERAVEKAFLAVADARPRGARVEQTSRQRPASGGR
jgi:hypothetical protein